MVRRHAVHQSRGRRRRRCVRHLTGMLRGKPGTERSLRVRGRLRPGGPGAATADANATAWTDTSADAAAHVVSRRGTNNAKANGIANQEADRETNRDSEQGANPPHLQPYRCGAHLRSHGCDVRAHLLSHIQSHVLIVRILFLALFLD